MLNIILRDSVKIAIRFRYISNVGISRPEILKHVPDPYGKSSNGKGTQDAGTYRQYK